MPALGDKAGELLFFCRKADDKAVFRAMMKPFLLLGSGEADAGNGDIKRQAGLMLAGACGCDGLIGRGEASVTRPAGVILLIFGDGVIDQLLLFAVCAISGGDLEIGNAFVESILPSASTAVRLAFVPVYLTFTMSAERTEAISTRSVGTSVLLSLWLRLTSMRKSVGGA